MDRTLSHVETMAVAVCLIAIIVAASVPALAQDAALAANKLTNRVYWVEGGSGANTGVIVADNEAIVIDAKMTAESAQAMLAEVGKLTPKPVKHVILTHSDGDHVNGLVGFPKGLPIVAQENTKKHMTEACKDPAMSALLPYLPSETVAAKKTLAIQGVRIELLHFGPAHTDGDMVVFLPDEKIAFVGDLLFIGRDPLIHRHKNGTSHGLIHTLEELLKLDVNQYVSGHASPVSKTEVRGLLDSIKEKQTKVKAMISAGKSLDEVKAAFGVQESPTGARRRPGLIEIIYEDLRNQG